MHLEHAVSKTCAFVRIMTSHINVEESRLYWNHGCRAAWGVPMGGSIHWDISLARAFWRGHKDVHLRLQRKWTQRRLRVHSPIGCIHEKRARCMFILLWRNRPEHLLSTFFFEIRIRNLKEFIYIYMTYVYDYAIMYTYLCYYIK